MKVKIQDLQRYWPVMSYLPHALLQNVRLVHVLGQTGTDVLLVTNDHKVFVYGLNLNLTESCCYNVPNLIEIKELSQKPIRGCASNSQLEEQNTNLSVVFYLTNGEVYLWGRDPCDTGFNTTPNLIEGLPETVVKVACGRKHFLAVTSDGQVYAWGRNDCGQTACKLTEHEISQPRKISFPFGDVAEIACGSSFSVVITRKSEVFGWGLNVHGVLGKNGSEIGVNGEDIQYRPVVREVSVFKNIGIQQIVCGDSHLLALNNCGVLFCHGSNFWGQLGYDPALWTNTRTRTVGNTRISLRFKEIAATGDSSVGETVDGDIMVWGHVTGRKIFPPLKTPCRSITEAFALYRLGGMYKEIEVATESETVAETVRKSFGNQEMSDFVIIVEEKVIHVQKSILALRSKYFKSMFAKDWLEGKMSFIKMNESYDGMSAFLKYLYTDEMNIVDMTLLVDVAIIAEKYCELNLVQLCLKQFESGLNQSNVAEWYELTLNLSNFNDLCINYASRCLRAVVASRAYKSWDSETFKTFFLHDKIMSILATGD